MEWSVVMSECSESAASVGPPDPRPGGQDGARVKGHECVFWWWKWNNLPKKPLNRKGIIFWCQRKIHRCGIGDEKVCSTPTSVSSDKNCRIARSLGVFGISCWFGTRTLDYSEQEHSPLRVRHTVLFTALAPLTATIGYSINSSKSRRGWVVVT